MAVAADLSDSGLSLFVTPTGQIHLTPESAPGAPEYVLSPQLAQRLRKAHAAGLGSLQDFLEAGFDTFASMTRHAQGVDIFLSTIEQREAGLIDTLFDESPVACATKLDAILGQVR